MDEGPFRMQSAPDRRGAGRPAVQPAARQPEPVQQPVAAEPRAAVKQAASQGPQKKSPKGLKWLLVLLVATVAEPLAVAAACVAARWFFHEVTA